VPQRCRWGPLILNRRSAQNAALHYEALRPNRATDLSETLEMPLGNLRMTRGNSESLLALLATSRGSFLWFLSTCARQETCVSAACA
jgi:hypothetical protein